MSHGAKGSRCAVDGGTDRPTVKSVIMPPQTPKTLLKLGCLPSFDFEKCDTDTCHDVSPPGIRNGGVTQWARHDEVLTHIVELHVPAIIEPRGLYSVPRLEFRMRSLETKKFRMRSTRNRAHNFYFSGLFWEKLCVLYAPPFQSLL